MAFIGTPLDTRNTFQSLQGKRFDGDGSTTAFTLDVAPSSTLDIEVFVGNVRQDPNSAYTLSGTTLTFTGAPPSGTNNIYVVHQAKSVGTIDPPATETIAKTFSGATTVSGALVASSTTLVDTLGVKTAKDLGVGIHVRSADSGASANSLADELVLENSGSSGLTIASGTSSSGSIYFGDSGDDDIGKIAYSHSTNSMSFTTNTAVGLKIDNAGHVTKPLQPAFLVRPSSDQADLATGATDVAWGAEIFDVNANFASNTFTAPVTGKYQFNVSLYLSEIDIDTTLFDVVMIASNRQQRLMAANFAKDFSADGNDFHSMNASTILDMDASDTISVRINITGGGGVIHLNGSAPSSEFYTNWSGALIC